MIFFQLANVTLMVLKTVLVMKMVTVNANVTSRERNVMNAMLSIMDSLSVMVSHTENALCSAHVFTN